MFMGLEYILNAYIFQDGTVNWPAHEKAGRLARFVLFQAAAAAAAGVA